MSDSYTEILSALAERPKILVQQGSNDSVTHMDRRSGVFMTNELGRLTEERREILRSTFAVMKHHITHNSLTVFIRLFSEYPLYKDLWPQFRTIPDSSLMYSNELRKHAQVFSRGLNTIIEKMDNEVELSQILRKMAKAHTKKNIVKNHVMNMLTEYLIVLKSAGVDVDDKVTDAWTTLFDLIGNLVDPLKPERERIMNSTS